jgi:predicted XRE-type DNA-binding protein
MARKRSRTHPPALIKKAILAKEIARILRYRGLTQTEAAYIIRDAASQLSLIVTGKLDGFSAERLVRILTRLGRDVQITIRRSRGPAGRVRLRVR